MEDNSKPQGTLPSESPAPPLQPTPVNPQENPIYPSSTPQANTPNGDQLVGLTGSNIAPEKKPVLKGVIVLFALGIIGFSINFFGGSPNPLFQILLFVDLAITFALLFRINAARQIVVVLSIITIILQSLSAVQLKRTEDALVTLKTKFDNAVSLIDEKQTSPRQQEAIDVLRKDIEAKETQTAKIIQVAYAAIALNVTVAIVKVVYLTRPKVKQAFQETT